MRIDLYGSGAPDSVINQSGTAVTAAPKPSPRVAEDIATLSPGSVSVPSLAQQALRTSEVRSEKVGALQRAVNSGAYTLDPGLIAEAMINEGL